MVRMKLWLLKILVTDIIVVLSWIYYIESKQYILQKKKTEWSLKNTKSLKKWKNWTK